MWGDRGVMRKAVIHVTFWNHTAGKFMMSTTQYNAKIKCISVKWSEIWRFPLSDMGCLSAPHLEGNVLADHVAVVDEEKHPLPQTSAA